jgi:HEAT repeat protein
MVAFREMGADASNAVPAVTKVLADTGVGSQTNSFFYVRAAAAVALGKIGPPAASALPALKAALQESNSYLRGQAAVATWRVAADADTALPILLKEMPAAAESQKWDWIAALGEMGPRARAAVPQLLVELRQDKIDRVLVCLTNALKSIDPEAAAEAGVQ